MAELSGQFPELALRGDALQRGYAHGEQLRPQIHALLEYYKELFGLSGPVLRAAAVEFAEIIRGFRPDYSREIEAIAAAANLDPLDVFALNSRSELLNNVSVPECTAVMNTETALLAQNWDWSEVLEDLVVLVAIEREDGHRIRMLTEPGIIGKIGMNSAGLGVCLNILKSTDRLQGLPVHVLLRAILDCGGMEEVRDLLARVSVGKASHVLVGDAGGDCLGIEFAGTRSYQLQPEAGILLHTNHYLADPALNTVEAFPTTRERLEQSREWVCSDASTSGLQALLRDQSRGTESVCRPYSPSQTPGFGNVGSVFTVLMDLAAGSMQILRGPAADSPAYSVAV
jgi:isopenicillin-N N-acyltransferase-like protein